MSFKPQKTRGAAFVAIRRRNCTWEVCLWTSCRHKTPEEGHTCATWWDAEKLGCELAKRRRLPLVETWTSRSAQELELEVGDA